MEWLCCTCISVLITDTGFFAVSGPMYAHRKISLAALTVYCVDRPLQFKLFDLNTCPSHSQHWLNNPLPNLPPVLQDIGFQGHAWLDSLHLVIGINCLVI